MSGLLQPANLIGLIILVYVNIGSPPVERDLKKLENAYKVSIALLIIVTPYILSLSGIRFCFSQFLLQPLTGMQITILGVFIFVFSLLAPIAWVVIGRKDAKVNRTHFILNFLGAAIAFIAIILLNKLPLSQIDSNYYNSLLLTETIILSSAIYVQFNYESRTTITIIEKQKNSIASVLNALWLTFALSIYGLALVHGIAAFKTDALPVIFNYFDVRWVLLMLSAIFCVVFVFTETSEFRKTLFPLFFIGAIAVLFIAIIMLINLPENIVSLNAKSWIVISLCIIFVYGFQKFMKKISEENSKLWDNWSTYVVSFFLFCLSSAIGVMTLY